MKKLTDRWKPFRMVQDAFFEQGYLKLPAKEIKVYFALHHFMDDEGNSYPTRETLRKLTGLSKDSISRATRSLEMEGLITAKQRRGEKMGIWLSQKYHIETITAPYKEKSVTKKDGHGYTRDKKGRFRRTVTKNDGHGKRAPCPTKMDAPYPTKMDAPCPTKMDTN